MRVFKDPTAVIIRDHRAYGSETRYQAISAVEGAILFRCICPAGWSSPDRKRKKGEPT